VCSSFPRAWLIAIASVLLALWAAAAFAGPAAPAPLAPAGHDRGRVELSVAGRPYGPVVLSPGQGGWVGEFSIRNTGGDPLTVSRLSIRGDADDVRSPSHLFVRFAEGASTSATIPPGGTKAVVVSWMPDKDPRVRQAFGHVVVTSTDETAGEVAMGFRAQLPTGLGVVGEHALTLLAVAPLSLVLLVAASWIAGRRDDPMVRTLSGAVAAFELALAFWVYHRFATDVGRADGNDGFQLVERAVWVRSIGAEWYVGVDGTSLPLLLLAAAVVAFAIAMAAIERREGAFLAALALVCSGAMGVLVALDLVVLCAAWTTTWLGMVLLVGGWGGARRHRSGAKVAAAGALGSGALLVALASLARSSGGGFLVDGTAVAHTLALPELGRSSFLAHAPLFGVPLVDFVWAMLLAAAALTGPLVPLHGWLPDVLEDAPPAAGILLAGAVSALGPYLLVRVGFGAVPEGAPSAASSIATLGAVGAAWGSLCAMVQRDLRRFFAYASIATVGVCFYGLAGLTPEGITGAIMILVAHGLSAMLLLGLAFAVDERVQTRDMTRLSGLVAEAPALAGAAAVGLGVSLGVPGLAGGWGELLALIGGFARFPVLALVLCGAIVASAVAHLRVARLVFLERSSPAWRSSAALEPFGGRLPDATPAELLALVPVAAVALLLGLWPAPVLSLVTESARDIAADVGGAPGP